MVLRARLEAAGYRVRTASCGLDGLDSMRAEPPDLVVLDLMLPGIDGLGVCALVKSDLRLRRIPILLLTARSQPRRGLTGSEPGADAYMGKPFQADELLAEVHRLLDDGKNTYE